MENQRSLAKRSLNGATILLVLATMHLRTAAQAALRQPETNRDIPAQAVSTWADQAPPHPGSAPGIVVADANSQHLTVGRSMVINTALRLRRVFVSNPEVLSSLTASPCQVVVSARAAGSGSVILWNESGESETYPVSADIDVEGLEKALKDALPNDHLQIEVQQDRISLAGTVPGDESAEVALKLAGLYSKNVINSLRIERSHATQVQLKVRIVEVDRTKLAQTGFNFFSIGKNTANFTTGQFPSVATGSNSSSSSSSSQSGGGTTSALTSLLQLSDPLNLLYFNSGLGVGEAIKAMEEKQVLQILAEPTITTMSGEKASFLSGGEFPFPVVQGGTGGLTSVTVQFRPYGVKLDFTPVVTAPGVIRLKVSPEVSALDYSNAVTISGYTIPALATRRAETQVELKDGQSFAISGLLDHRTTDLLEKTPGIGDIPILGYLFRSKNINHSVVKLMVIVTPTLVDSLSDTRNPEEPQMPSAMMSSQSFDRSLPSQKISPTSGGKRP